MGGSIDLLAGGVVGLEHDPGAAFEVEAQANGAAGDEGSGAGEHGDDNQRADERRWTSFSFSSAAADMAAWTD